MLYFNAKLLFQVTSIDWLYQAWPEHLVQKPHKDEPANYPKLQRFAVIYYIALVLSLFAASLKLQAVVFQCVYCFSFGYPQLPKPVPTLADWYHVTYLSINQSIDFISPSINQSTVCIYPLTHQ